MALGWVSIHRKIQDHWLWEDKPFSKGVAWVDLLMLANHTEGKVVLGNSIIEVKAGTVVTSKKKLAERWGWSNTKVNNFLELLEKDDMVTTKSTTKHTIVTIENYSDYQDNANEKTYQKHNENISKAHQKHNKSITETYQKHTINNENNENNDNNKKKNTKKKKYHESELLDKAIGEYVEYRAKIKKPMTDRAVELLIGKLDKLATREEEKIAILNQSIVNGWQGIFPLKEEDKPSLAENPDDIPYPF